MKAKKCKNPVPVLVENNTLKVLLPCWKTEYKCECCRATRGPVAQR